MSFAWPAHRVEPHARSAVFVAMAITAMAALALSPSLESLYRLHGSSGVARSGEPPETAVYVVPPAPALPVRHRVMPAPSTRATRARRRAGPPPSRTDSGAASPNAARQPIDTAAARAPAAAGAPAPSPGAAAASHAAIGPVAAPVGVTRSPATSELYVPLRLRTKWMSFMDLVRQTKPTQAQRDSTLRAQERTRVAARGDGRPMPLGMGHVRLPLFSQGPSQAQRVRDSIVNADYLRRLAVLEARARGVQDSLRRADSAKRVAAGRKPRSRP